jgi:N-glycosylase/DNA lyase
MDPALSSTVFPVENYDLAATLSSGQVFGWRHHPDDTWTGVVQGRWVRLQPSASGLLAWTASPPPGWLWLRDFLQLDAPLDRITATFPEDDLMQRALATCAGLRLLKQDPWECLASFILSSTKQIVQIEQIVARLGSRFGTAVAVPPGTNSAFAFPTAAQLVQRSEAELRECKMGFRAPYLLAAACRVAEGRLDWRQLASLPLPQAREQLMEIPGVGRKIADCVLLFTGLFPSAFPLDVWMLRTLHRYYFKNQPPPRRILLEFTDHHFGPHAGYAQQYLFHFARLGKDQVPSGSTENSPPY